MAGFRTNSKIRKRTKENYCRICLKMFCCKNCRLFHEETNHKIIINCDICKYGKIWSGSITTLPAVLLSHIKSTHFPLHCLYCKIVFQSIDDLLNHKLCKRKLLISPTTPITPNSGMFCESLKTGLNNPHIFYMGLTSTPMQKPEDDDRLTPLKDIKLIMKSSLKSGSNLRSNSNLSESRKSDRRVTFSDTPIIRYSPKDIDNFDYKDDSTDDTFYTTTNMDIKNLVEIDNKNTNDDKNDTLWESAISNCDWNISSELESSVSNENLAVNLNIIKPVSLLETPESCLVETNIGEINGKSLNLWSSVTKIVKSVVHNISITTQYTFVNGNKRRLPIEENLEQTVPPKKRKFTDIKCRRPIRAISPMYQMRIRRPIMVDKSTQTDDIFWEKI